MKLIKQRNSVIQYFIKIDSQLNLRFICKMKKIMVLLIILGFSQQILAQTFMDTSAIISELAYILERDQKTRTGKDSAGFMRYIDSCNLVQIEKIIAEHGWLGMSVVGPSGNNTCLLYTSLILLMKSSSLKMENLHLIT